VGGGRKNCPIKKVTAESKGYFSFRKGGGRNSGANGPPAFSSGGGNAINRDQGGGEKGKGGTYLPSTKADILFVRDADKNGVSPRLPREEKRDA